jgi:hypothetical protein
MAKRKSKKSEYESAVRAVADAAQRAEDARRKFDEVWKTLGREKSDADLALREALEGLRLVSEGRNGKEGNS